MGHIDFTLPFTDPILRFSIVLTIILAAPLVLNRLRIPHIIGLILAGAVIGPNGLGLLLRDSSFELFGNVGLLYIMFLAGVEMELADFKKNKNKSIVFGLFTFTIPIVTGTIVCYYVLKMSLISSILLASMFATHTLIAYPIVGRFGVVRNRSVNITVGGTMITDTLALLILAVISGMTKGNIEPSFWISLTFSFLLFGLSVLYLFPILARIFFRCISDQVLQYVFVLALLFFAAFLAELAGMEGILGAFLAGIALNKLIPSVSPLMNRLEFVGNALFIPYFLIGVGMLIDVGVFFHGTDALVVAFIMTTVALLAKWCAAWVTRRTFHFLPEEGLMIFGLSSAHATATLAVVMVGFDIGLFDESILNGTIIVILITCTVSSFASEKAARKIALNMKEVKPKNTGSRRVLIPVANPNTLNNLLDVAFLYKHIGRANSLYALSVVDDSNEGARNLMHGRKLLETAGKVASSVDTELMPLIRYDINISSGICHTIKERNITDVVMGLHYKSNIVDSFLGSKIERLIKDSTAQLFILKCIAPINTFRRMILAVPPRAEYEVGFMHWMDTMSVLAREMDLNVLIYTHPDTQIVMRQYYAMKQINLEIVYEELNNWDDFLITSKDVRRSDLFVVVTPRSNSLSYVPSVEKLPMQLSQYYANTNLVLLYPAISEENESIPISFADPLNLNAFNTGEKIVDVRQGVRRAVRAITRHFAFLKD